jgi:hypothetical protein
VLFTNEAVNLQNINLGQSHSSRTSICMLEIHSFCTSLVSSGKFQLAVFGQRWLPASSCPFGTMLWWWWWCVSIRKLTDSITVCIEYWHTAPLIKTGFLTFLKTSNLYISAVQTVDAGGQNATCCQNDPL